MKKWILLIALPLWALLTLYSCGELEEEEYLNFVETELSVNFEGGSEIVGISSNISWNVISSASWCMLENGSGSGSGSLVLKIEKNKDISERVAKITISGGYVKQDLMVRQSGSMETLTDIPEKDSMLLSINVEQGKWYYFKNEENQISGYFYVNETSGTAGSKVIDIDIVKNDIYKRSEYVIGDDEFHAPYMGWSYSSWRGYDFAQYPRSQVKEADASALIFCLNPETDSYTITSPTIDNNINVIGKATKTLFCEKQPF
ncbi:MAG: BACON domain-containing protein [Paludibacteraceae bacterium]|nr:BACON domain-containing protein [Paludibacteraceae bacterium]